MKESVEVIRVESDGRTGVNTYHVRARFEDEAGNVITGPEEAHSIDFHSLASRHGGCYRRWMTEFVKADVLKRHSSRKASQDNAPQAGECF